MTTMFFIAIDVLQCLAVQTAAIDNPTHQSQSFNHISGIFTAAKKIGGKKLATKTFFPDRTEEFIHPQDFAEIRNSKKSLPLFFQIQADRIVSSDVTTIPRKTT